ERLALCLCVSAEEQPAFLKCARSVQAPGATASRAPTAPVVPQSTRDVGAAVPPAGNLPAPVNRFVGRETQCAQVGDLLRRPDVRLLTLPGPPGIGKPRLALQVGRAMLGDFANGVFFVPLAAVDDPALVVAAIARTLGVAEGAQRPLFESLLAYL